MQDINKQVTAFVRSMKRLLKSQHGIEVPHAALRASLLAAQGENPHAFAAKSRASETSLRELIAEAPHYFHPGYDFDGKKLQWLQRAGLVPGGEPTSKEARSAETRTLYLVDDEDGMERILALDPAGHVPVPADFEGFTGTCTVLELRAQVPKVSRYGLPDYYNDPSGFFRSYGLSLSGQYSCSYEDLGDDSGDSAVVTVQVPDNIWGKLLVHTLRTSPQLYDGVAEWVGLHYGRNFDTEAGRQAEWVERFLDSLDEGARLAPARSAAVVFEYVYPDEDGGSCPALVYFDTGHVRLLETVPDDVTDSMVRTRIWTGEEVGDGDDVPVYFQQADQGGQWKVRKKDMPAVRALRN